MVQLRCPSCRGRANQRGFASLPSLPINGCVRPRRPENICHTVIWTAKPIAPATTPISSHNACNWSTMRRSPKALSQAGVVANMSMRSKACPLSPPLPRPESSNGAVPLLCWPSVAWRFYAKFVKFART